jgi:lipoate-protein ligase A
MIRRLNLGAVSPLRSQAIYHGLAAAMDSATPDTVVFCTPGAPYFCVGYHQRADQVLDLDLCRARGWPVFRRKIGGGAVYLDGGQLFYQVVVHRSRAPLAVDRIYARYLAAPVLALRRLGLAARLAPPNEIEVGGRRIAGTGGGQLGEAVVVVGNVLFDFPDARMARAWRTPSAPFRRLARQGLRRYLTTLRHQLGSPPTPDGMTELLATAYSETLGQPLAPGALSEREAIAIETAERELASTAFLLDGGGRSERGLKIARGVYVYEGQARSADIRVTLRLRHGRVDAVAIRGAGARLAKRLVGSPLGALGLASGAGNPADAVGDLLASEWYKVSVMAMPKSIYLCPTLPAAILAPDDHRRGREAR